MLAVDISDTSDNYEDVQSSTCDLIPGKYGTVWIDIRQHKVFGPQNQNVPIATNLFVALRTRYTTVLSQISHIISINSLFFFLHFVHDQNQRYT